MFSRLKEFFTGQASLEVDGQGQASDKELQVATAALLLEIAGSDEDYAPEEVQESFAALEKAFNITDLETMEIFELAQKSRKDKGDITEFIDAVKNNFSLKQRQLVLAMVWKVVLADEQTEINEQKFASHLRQRLELSREQAEEAKRMAEEGKV